MEFWIRFLAQSRVAQRCRKPDRLEGAGTVTVFMFRSEQVVHVANRRKGYSGNQNPRLLAELQAGNLQHYLCHADLPLPPKTDPP